jgi:hypothetical protein
MPGHFQQCAVSKSTEAPNATNHLCLEVYQAEVNLRAVKNIARLEMGFLWLWLLPADLGSETVTKKLCTLEDCTGFQHQERINITCTHAGRGAVSLCKQNLILTVRFSQLVLQIIMDVVSTTETVEDVRYQTEETSLFSEDRDSKY